MFENVKGDSLMLKKNVLATTMMVAALALATVQLGAAQADAPKNHDAEKAVGAYRLDFTLTELEDGKKINSRQYSMNSRSEDWNEIKIGSRVPVESKGEEWQYLDVGTNIRCKLLDQTDMASLGGSVALSVNADLSSFAIPEQQGQSVHPTIRQMKIGASTIAVVGKPMVVGVVDDPNSKRQFQLEVVVTKLR
jgi:hypothetical protein